MNVIDLKALASPGRYRTSLDESAAIDGQTREERMWLVQLPGARGHVFVQSETTLGAYVVTRNDGSNRLGRLLALPGTRLLQRGDYEASVEFQPEDLDAVAAILRLRRRARLSDERRQMLAARLAGYRAKAAQEGQRSA